MNERRMTLPATDIYETKDKYYVVMDMPGASKESIEISAEDERLTITAKVAETDKEWKPLRSEFTLTDYQREFTIGSQVNRENIEAKYENGILTVTLEKSELAKPKKIEVKAA